MRVHTRLRSAHIKACRTVLDIKVDFPERGLVLLQGLNTETGGSSNSGKSNFIMGVMYGLDCAPMPATHLQSCLTEEKLSSTVELQIHEGGAARAEITRGAKAGMRSWHAFPTGNVYGVSLRGAKGAEAGLREALLLDSDLVRLLTYRPQHAGSQFLGMDDAEKKAILVRLIPELAQVEKAATKASEEAQEAAKYLEHNRSVLAVLEESPVVGPSEGELVQQELEVECAQGAIDDAKGAWKLAEMGLTAAQERFKASADDLMALAVPEALRLRREASKVLTETVALPSSQLMDACAARLKKAREADAQRQDRHQQNHMDLLVRSHPFQFSIDQRPRISKELEAAKAALTSLRARRCQTCHQEWLEGAELELARKEAVKGKLEAELQASFEAEKALQHIQEEKAVLGAFVPDPKLAQLESVLATVTAGYQLAKRVYQEKLTQAEATARAQRDLLRSQADEAEKTQREALGKVMEQDRLRVEVASQLVKAKLELVSIAKDKHRAELAILVELRAQATRVGKYKALVASARSALADAQEQWAAKADLAEALGRSGFLGAIFDEILAEMAAETNEALAGVPNTSKVVFRFSSDGQRITPLVTSHGHEGQPKFILSGGMLSVFWLTFDLAFGTVVSRRVGGSPGWLFLDEPLDGLGAVEKEAALEVLRRYAQDRLIVVVDHATEVRESFDQTISLVCEGGVTRLR